MKKGDPKELAETILNRSTCNVMVGAVIRDGVGVISWGWNSSGPDGYGQHAEAHAISRANQDRLRHATIYVASKRKSTGKWVVSKPCPDCQRLVDKWELKVKYIGKDGVWHG